MDIVLVVAAVGTEREQLEHLPTVILVRAVFVVGIAV